MPDLEPGVAGDEVRICRGWQLTGSGSSAIKAPHMRHLSASSIMIIAIIIGAHSGQG
jgi:hypothetical protein